eukprot:3758986-Amphidinium_carterae.3
MERDQVLGSHRFSVDGWLHKPHAAPTVQGVTTPSYVFGQPVPLRTARLLRALQCKWQAGMCCQRKLHVHWRTRHITSAI